MSPVLNNGDYVVTKKPRSIRPGFIYVIDHSDLGQIVKRLDRIDDDRFYFSGDNAASVPSSIIAPVTRDRITAEARYVIGPSGIKRLSLAAPHRT